DVEVVGVHVHRVEQTDVTFTLLDVHEHNLEAFEKLPGVQVALDGGPHAQESADEVLRPRRVENSGIQLRQLPEQHRIQHRTGHAALAQIQGFVRREIGPPRFGCIADEGALDGTAFRAEGHGVRTPTAGYGFTACRATYTPLPSWLSIIFTQLVFSKVRITA